MSTDGLNTKSFWIEAVRFDSPMMALDDRILNKQVETLYGPIRSLVIGALTGIFVGMVVTIHTGSPFLAAFVVISTVVVAGRLLLVRAYQAARAQDRVSSAAEKWEKRYRNGAWIHASTVGGFALATFLISDHAVDHLVTIAQVCGYTSGVSARNAGRRTIATGQLVLILTPVIVGAALMAEPMYWALALLILLYMAAALEIVRYHHANNLRLLLLNDEKSALAVELALQNERFDVALSNMSHALCMVDAEKRFVVANDRFCEMFSLHPDHVHGTHIRDIVQRASDLLTGSIREAEEITAHFEERLNSRKPSSSILHLADGRIVSLSQQPISGGGNVVIMEDVTERQTSEERVAHMATHDALTDLPNRILFRTRLNEHLAGGVNDGKTVAVLMLDLDRFKAVNDGFGHPAGDELLRQVALRLRGAIGEHDTVARLGGDEFVILAAQTTRPAILEFSARLIECLSEPYELDGQTVEVGASMGAAFAPDDGLVPEDLLKKADLALYQAKADGRGALRCFLPRMNETLQARIRLEHDLRLAMERQEFVLHYQPQVDLLTGRIAGVEALLRWEHPIRGCVSPADFIPLAEETGIIIPLGAWVLRQACRDAATWPGDVPVAANLSPVQFRGNDLVPTVMDALAASGLAPGRLELEITESTLLVNTQTTMEALHRLREFGIRVAMDDFGIGYSSLAYLRSFPFDKIKIDRSFVTEIDTSEDCAAIIRAVAGLGHSLGVVTTAEGVETSEQHDLVVSEGCTQMQGYYFSPPRPLPEIVAMLQAQTAAEQLAA